MNEGREETYLSLTQFMQKLAVGDPVTINCATRPMDPPWNAVLLAGYMAALEDHFPGLLQESTTQ